MARMALMAPKRAQEERNALSALFTWYAPYRVALSTVHECSSASAVESKRLPCGLAELRNLSDMIEAPVFACLAVETVSPWLVKVSTHRPPS